MPLVSDLCQFLDTFAPPVLAEEWDNVGLLVGDPRQQVERVMTCLTITPASCAEAVSKQADLIVTHHPLPFHPLRRLTSESTPGRLLLELIRAGIAVYSPHTAYDSAAAGINQQLAEGLALEDIQPLVPLPADDTGRAGSGRRGRFASPLPLSEIVCRLRAFLKIGGLQAAGPEDAMITTAAIACGSGGSFLEPAIRQDLDLLITGEASFHTCLEAQASGIHLLLAGHFASERFALESLGRVLDRQFPKLTVWASEHEADPLRWTT
ncbi:MAG: Nif3-like dinuclear metal center hexameric protein [Pirellulaceae bacterium]|nr:Nif3-like dinuclear metal center hexameric protein [Pirellulaceae bacterium]